MEESVITGVEVKNESHSSFEKETTEELIPESINDKKVPTKDPDTPTNAAKRLVYSQLSKLSKLKEEEFMAQEEFNGLVLAVEKLNLDESLDKLEDEQEKGRSKPKKPKSYLGELSNASTDFMTFLTRAKESVTDVNLSKKSSLVVVDEYARNLVNNSNLSKFDEEKWRKLSRDMRATASATGILNLQNVVLVGKMYELMFGWHKEKNKNLARQKRTTWAQKIQDIDGISSEAHLKDIYNYRSLYRYLLNFI